MTTNDPREILMQYAQVSEKTAVAFLAARRENDPQRAAAIVQHVFDQQDVNLTFLVLSYLANTVICMEPAKPEGAPLSSLEKMGLDPNPRPWHVGVTDQIEAAAEAGDAQVLANLLVDGQMRALREDAAEGVPTDLQQVMKAVVLMTQETLCIVAAEALRRLLEASP